MYRFVDAAIVRVATLPSGVDVPPWPDLSGTTDEHVAQWCCWLRQVWAQNVIAEAVEVASPVLARRVSEVCVGREQRVRQVRRAVVSVMRYLLRATSRATPFGLFAGVAPARFGPELQLRYGEEHHAVARVNTEWLVGAITRLERCPELGRRLPVVLNNLAFVRDGRLVVGCQQPTESGRTEPAEVSVRHTRAVLTVIQAARSPIRVGDLAGKLMAEFPETSESVIDGMLAELVAQRVLVTSLRPPMTVTDPLAYVIEKLTAAGAEEVALLVAELREVHAELSRHNRASSSTERRESRTSASQRMAAIFATEQPVTVDLRVDCTLVLPQAVAREAEAAAVALARLSPYPVSVLAWQDYHHARFLERYGVGALVPLAEIVHAEAGLGFPAGYRDARLKPSPVPGLSERDVRLLVLAQHAAMDQCIEVVLDVQAIADLAVEAVATAQVQPHTELRFRVHAPTSGALGRGEFELAVVGVSRAAGTTTGRFLDLLDRGDRERMVGAYGQLPTVSADALPVQVSCPPLSPRAENVARSPAVLPHIISLAEHHTTGGVVPIDDLVVSGDAQRLYLMSLSRGRPLEPVVFNAVEFTHAAHPLLRFLCEISTARAASCAPFSWGAASRLPFLPRVRYRRTILSPARWMLAATDLPGPAAPWPQWVDALAAWRHRCRVPDAVYLGEGDRRLRLDLDEPAHLHLLRSDLDRTGHATVREAPEASAFGWFAGRAHEIVVPLAATTRPGRSPGPQRAWPARAIGPEHGHLPGASDWLYVKLYGHPERHTAILTTHLPGLLSAWDSPPQWWFIRYQDPEPHLRLRIRLPGTDAFGETAQRVGAWAAGLRRLGLIGPVQLDTYYPETGRFGDGAAMAAAESVFAADSAAAIAQLRYTGRRGAPHQHAILAASMVDLATSFTGSSDDGMRWLIDHVDKTPTPAPAREVHDQAIRLADPHDRWAALRAIPGGEDIATAWARRRTALAAYRNTLTACGETATEVVLPDLLHLHHVRMVGICPDTEQACARLARAAALSWTTRTHTAT